MLSSATLAAFIYNASPVTHFRLPFATIPLITITSVAVASSQFGPILRYLRMIHNLGVFIAGRR